MSNATSSGEKLSRLFNTSDRDERIHSASQTTPSLNYTFSQPCSAPGVSMNAGFDFTHRSNENLNNKKIQVSFE